jgi:hypothetical protein
MGFFFAELPDPLIGKTHVGYLIANLCFVQIGQLEITFFPRLLDSNRYCIEAAGLEAAILDGEAGGEAVELGDDPVLEVEDWILAHRAAAFLEQPSKHAGVARLVGALAGEVHADFPILAWKIAEIARGAFEAVDFFVHLAVQELNHLFRMPDGKVRAFDPALLDGKPPVPSRSGTEQARIGSVQDPAPA